VKVDGIVDVKRRQQREHIGLDRPDQQLQRVRRELLLRQTKTPTSDSTLPIPDLVATALELRRVDQEKDKAEAGEIWRGPPQGPHLVFTGKCGTPVDPRTLNRRFTARCDKAGSSLAPMSLRSLVRTEILLIFALVRMRPGPIA